MGHDSVGRLSKKTTKEKIVMTNIMILNTNEFETKRSLETGRRLFIIPFSEKQNIYAIEEFHMDT